jgi:type I restriction enzyme S subunit
MDPSQLGELVVAHFSIPAFDAGSGPDITSASAIGSSKLVVPDTAVLVSKLNPQTPRVWLPNLPARHRGIASTEFLILTPSSRIDRSFLAYACRTPVFAEEMAGRRTGTTGSHQRVRSDDVMSIRIPLPPLSEQRCVAGVLSSLEEKGQVNSRLIRAMDRIIELSVAVPNSSWPSLPVARLARFVNGGAYTKGASGRGRMVLRIAELNSGPGPSTVFNELDVPDDQVARFGDVLMSWSGSLGVYRWTRAEAIVNQHIFKVIADEFPNWFVFVKLKGAMERFRAIAADKATTMGHIKRQHLEETTVSVPPTSELAAFDFRLRPLWDRIILAERESASLAEVFNSLLPEVISGRIRVAQRPEAMPLLPPDSPP